MRLLVVGADVFINDLEVKEGSARPSDMFMVTSQWLK